MKKPGMKQKPKKEDNPRSRWVIVYYPEEDRHNQNDYPQLPEDLKNKLFKLGYK